MAEKGRPRRGGGSDEVSTQIQRHQNVQDEEDHLKKLWDELESSETGEDIDPEKFLRDMAILDELYPLPDFDMTSSWKDFQEKYAHLLASSASADQQSSASDPAEIPKRNRSRKPIRAVIAVVMILVMLMMAASCGVIERFLKAIGIDSEEIFSFLVVQELRVEDPTPERTDMEYFDTLEEALDTYGVTTEYAGIQLPRGYNAGKVQTWERPNEIKFLVKYLRGNEEILFTIWHYRDSTSLELNAAEKLPPDAYTYACGDNSFYIIENTENTTVTWIDGTEKYSLWGPFSVTEASQMIDSVCEGYP